MDVNIEIDADELLNTVDLNDYITVDIEDLGIDGHIQDMLEVYIGDRHNMCPLGKLFQQAVRITVQEMMADPQC
tara:strand:- start:222 stop:443 length:222 start_codon:yes stop_codon:yes gene_type:complete